MQDRPDWTPDGVRVLERTNGTAAPPLERPNPLRRIDWVPLGDEYPGLEVKLWANPPNTLVGPLRRTQRDSDPEATMLALLKVVVLDHRDQDGQPWQHPYRDGLLAPPSSDEFWEAIPDDVLQIISVHIEDRRKKVNASIARIFTGSSETSSGENRQSEPDPTGSAGTTSDATWPSAGTATPEP